MTTLLEEINLMFERARLEVTKCFVPKGEKPYTDIVLIVDNLEKIRKFETMQDGLASQRELFLERYTQLTGLSVHVVYTMPLRLARSVYAPQLAQRYSEPFVLPMVKVMERGTRAPYEKGREFLREMLQKRMETNVALDDAFTPTALDFLLTYSGGHARSLMMFVQNACAYSTSTPIPLEAAHRAIQQSVRLFSGSIPEEYWTKLAELDRSPDQKIPNGDEAYSAMLENVSVLEYINGDGKNDPFNSPEPWYAVNPIVRELQKFKSAASALPKKR